MITDCSGFTVTKAWLTSVDKTQCSNDFVIIRGIENGYKVKHVPILEVPKNLDYFLLIRDKSSWGSKISLWNTVYMLCGTQLCQKISFPIPIYHLHCVISVTLSLEKPPVHNCDSVLPIFLCEYLYEVFWCQKDKSHLFHLLGYDLLTSTSVYPSTQEH